MKVFSITALIIISLQQSAFAEYRVYQYYVKAKEFKAQDNRSYVITTSFNPVTYQAYNGGPESVQIELLRTWICPGHTGGLKVYCPSPYEGLLKLEDTEQRKGNNI